MSESEKVPDENTIPDFRMNRAQVGEMSSEAILLADKYDKDELGLQIARRAGNKYTGTIDKETCNNVYAYLTGAHYIKPANVHRTVKVSIPGDSGAVEERVDVKSATAMDIRKAIAEECGFEYPKREYASRFNKAERAMVLAEMQNRGDQRDWMP